MGNAASGSKDRHSDESVDFGALIPQDRKLAPFYRPLEEYEEDWDDDHILAARKENPNAPTSPLPEPPASASSTSSKFHKNPHKTGKEPFRPTEASVYRGAVECPICFLFYPPNINRSRCCDQAICTECFVQIKRAEPTTTHLVSEPAACPYCVQDNFGITYEPPPWRTGLMSDVSALSRAHMHLVNSASSAESDRSKRRKSFGADSPEVVTIDQIRPDWEAKLAAVRAAVTRRANRRIIMRQVGDRLIPIGITSGRAHGSEEAISGSGEGAESGRRSRRRNHGGQELNQILGSVGLGGLGGQDLEELMVMEAMRLSLLEHEQQQRRQTNGNVESSNHAQHPSGDGSGNGDTPVSSASPSPRPSLSPPSRPSISPARPPSPRASSAGMSPRQGPSRSRLPITPSPLGNGGESAPMLANLPHPFISVSDAPSASLQPPTGHIHRRTGSSPEPPSSTTLAAALSAAQTASAFFNSAEAGRTEGQDRHTQGIPRSAPATRAASPSLVEPEACKEESRRLGTSALPFAPPSSGPTSDASATSSANVLSPSPASLIQVSASEVDADGLSRNIEGYKPLGSSTESGEPSWTGANSPGVA